MKDIQKFAQKYSFDLLRFSLAITLIWFGVLKIIDASPVETIVFEAMPPFIATFPWFFLLLGIGEAVIGIGLVMRRLVPYASLLLILHLVIATLSVLITQGFSPTFPLLTLEGEFVVKNAVLIAGAFVLLGKK